MMISSGATSARVLWKTATGPERTAPLCAEPSVPHYGMPGLSSTRPSARSASRHGPPEPRKTNRILSRGAIWGDTQKRRVNCDGLNPDRLAKPAWVDVDEIGFRKHGCDSSFLLKRLEIINDPDDGEKAEYSRGVHLWPSVHKVSTVKVFYLPMLSRFREARKTHDRNQALEGVLNPCGPARNQPSQVVPNRWHPEPGGCSPKGLF